MSLLLLFNEEVNGTPQPAAYVRMSTEARTRVLVRVSMGTLNVGDVVDIDFEFRDSHSSELVNPTVPPLVRLQWTKCDGTVGPLITYTFGTDINVVELEPGRYRASVDLDTAGTWKYAIVSPGPTAKATEAGYFDVMPILGS